jgi:hypothetical protein
MLNPVAKDYTDRISPALRPLLADDERLLVASPLIKDPGTTDDISVGDELKNLLDPTILLGLGTHPGNLVQRAVFGRAVTGAPDSIARHLFDRVSTVTAPVLAVTTARLIVVQTSTTPTGTGFWQRWFGPVETTARGIHEVRREAILGSIAAPAGVLRRGRLLIGFVDGSGCVLVCAVPSAASRVIQVLAVPGPPSGPPSGPSREEHP